MRAFESLSLDEGADDCAAGGGPPLRCGWEPLQLTSLSLRGWSAITHLELSAAERLQVLTLTHTHTHTHTPTHTHNRNRNRTLTLSQP